MCDGKSSKPVKKSVALEVEYPIGHRRRRKEGIPLLIEKFEQNLALTLSQKQRVSISQLCSSQARLEKTPVNEFMDMLRV